MAGSTTLRRGVLRVEPDDGAARIDPERLGQVGTWEIDARVRPAAGAQKSVHVIVAARIAPYDIAVRIDALDAGVRGRIPLEIDRGDVARTEQIAPTARTGRGSAPTGRTRAGVVPDNVARGVDPASKRGGSRRRRELRRRSMVV